MRNLLLWFSGLVLSALMVLGLSACGDAPFAPEQTPSTGIPQPLIPDVNIPGGEDTSQTAGAATAVSRPTEMPVVLGNKGQWYAVDVTAHSDNGVLGVLTLHLLRVQRTDDGLLLRIAFEYEGDSEMSILGGASSRDIHLTDSSGNEYALSDGDQNLIAFNPEGLSFLPGGGVAGNLLFPVPEGREPYTLHFPEFEPVEFRLEREMEPPLVSLPPGSYAIGQTLHSNASALQPVALRVDSVDVEADEVTFHVAFVNMDRRGYDISGPNGMSDAWLIDADRGQYVPVFVSENLAAGIAPPDGWQPGQANEGTITFPLPTSPGVLRFAFRYYPAVTLTFDQTGLVSDAVTSLSGGPPPPTATPKPSQRAYQSINRMLVQQAQAILDGDEEAYLAPFAPELREVQGVIFRRMQQIPFSSYVLELDPGESLRDADRGEMNYVGVWGRYTLEGVPEDNDFRYTANYDFVKEGDSWQITVVRDDDFTPFWFLGDVVMNRSPHFLIFTRPDTEASTATLSDELESAYDVLEQRGLPLEPVNVVFFTAPDEGLHDLTGRNGTRVLGLAVAQYSFEENKVHVNSRAFFINGEAFARHADEMEADERAVTITHEMVHLALSKESRPFIPPWLSEGLAVYYANQAPPERLKILTGEGYLDRLSLTDLTAATSLGEHDVFGETVGYEYLYSGAVITYLVQNYGEEKVMAFYRAYATVPDEELAEKFSGMFAGLMADVHMSEMAQEKTPALVQEYFGMSLEELDAAVKAWLISSGGN